MEGSNTVVAPTSNNGTLHTVQVNRLHVRVSVRGNELELTDERADNTTAHINVQELISSFVGVLKTSAAAPPRSELIAKNTRDSDISTEKHGFEGEIMRLRQLVQQSEGEVMHLRKLFQDSKRENEELKIRFRSATHMKASEIAKRFSEIDVVKGVNDVRGPKGHSDLLETYPPEKTATEAILNPQVKEIDFVSLDDVLGGEDTAAVSSKRTPRDMPEEGAITSGNNSGLSDDKDYLNETSTQIFELPKATPPSVLKVGLDLDLARAGGECKVEDFSRSRLRKSPPGRGRSNNYDSCGEGDNVIQSDEELASPHSRSMVSTYGIMYRPSIEDRSGYKTVLIGNLPQDIDYHKLLAKIRGGCIISATLCNTTKLRGCGGRMSALVVFIDAKRARAYVEFAGTHGIYFDSHKAVVELINTPTYPLSTPAERRIGYGQTRYLVIHKYHSDLSLARIDRVINAGVNKHRVNAIERFWKDEDGNVRICFASINAASMAYWKLDNDSNYNRLKIRFEEDPCGRPLEDLLSTPLGRRFSDFIDTKVSYNDEDDPEDGSKTMKPANPPTDASMKNADEIVLEEGDEDVAKDGVSKGKAANDSMTNEHFNKDVRTMVKNDDNTLDGDYAKTETADMAMKAGEKAEEIQKYGKAQGLKTPEISKVDVKSTAHVVPMPKAENFCIPELVASSCMIPQLSVSVSEGPSAATAMITSETDGVLKSWADDANIAVEAGTLATPVESKTAIPPAIHTGINEEKVYPVIGFLPTIAEEERLTCKSVKGNSVKEAPAEALGVGCRTNELSTAKTAPVEDSVKEISMKQLATALHPAKPVPAPESPVERTGNPIVKLPSLNPTAAPDKFDLAGTDLDPKLLARYVVDTVLSEKPRGGLCTSRWADPKTKATKSIIVKAPQTVPVLGDTEKAASELLFGKPVAVKPNHAPVPMSLAPATAPKEPCAGAPGARAESAQRSIKSPIENQLDNVQKNPSRGTLAGPAPKKAQPAAPSAPLPTRPTSMSMSSKPQSSTATSIYAALDPDATRPHCNLRTSSSSATADAHSAFPQSPSKRPS